MHVDKTKNHFHIDIKFINQDNHSMVPGDFVYVNNSGIYNLAISSILPDDNITSNVQGVIWSILEHGFFIKTSFGPLKYREPFGPEFFNKDTNGNVLENSPKNELLPGDLGDKLWLSQTFPGKLQTTESNILIGYKSNFGMIYRPEFVWCAKPPTNI